jgi:hypothetical protein
VFLTFRTLLLINKKKQLVNYQYFTYIYKANSCIIIKLNDMSFFDDAISSIGQGLANTAAQEISASTGIDVGGTLGFLFGGGQTKGGGNMAAATNSILAAFGSGGTSPDAAMLSQLSATLDQQTQAIENLGTQLTGITNALSSIQGEIDGIETMLTKISQQQLFTDWNDIDIQLTEYITSIDSCYFQYGMYVSKYSTTPIKEIDYLAQTITNPNDGPLGGLKTINALLMGSGGESKGALQLWSLMVSPLVQDGTLDYRLAVQQYFQYYQKLVYAELKAVNLLIEAYIYNGDKNSADTMWDQYISQLLQQEDTFINWLVPLVYSGEIGGHNLAGDNSAVNFSFFEAATQLNPGVQQMKGDADPGNAFYTPSTIFQTAEQLLANLYVTGVTDRRIVVHMLYSNGAAIPTLLNGLSLTLTAATSGIQSTINPISHARLGGPFDFPGTGAGDYLMYADTNVYTGAGLYLKRYVYDDSAQSGLAVTGIYNVSNLNGHNGLIPIETYSGFTAPFQQNSVVNYALEVNSVSKFDFMNFAAYTFPIMIVASSVRGTVDMEEF